MAKARAKPDRSTAKRSRKLDRETILWSAVLAVLVVGMFGYTAYRWYRALPPTPEDLDPLTIKEGVVQEYPPMVDTSHLGDDDEAPNYHSDPPTSGRHYDDPTDPGFYTLPLPAEVLVANLERGDVVIYYSTTIVSESQREELKALVERYNQESQTGHVVAVPRQDEKYALIPTAWTRVLRLREFDLPTAEQFVKDFIGQGPGHPQ